MSVRSIVPSTEPVVDNLASVIGQELGPSVGAERCGYSMPAGENQVEAVGLRQVAAVEVAVSDCSIAKAVPG